MPARKVSISPADAFLKTLALKGKKVSRDKKEKILNGLDLLIHYCAKMNSDRMLDWERLQKQVLEGEHLSVEGLDSLTKYHIKLLQAMVCVEGIRRKGASMYSQMVNKIQSIQSQIGKERMCKIGDDKKWNKMVNKRYAIETALRLGLGKLTEKEFWENLGFKYIDGVGVGVEEGGITVWF